MGKVVRFERCPKCAKAGRDRRGDNLGVYADGSSHCFANCGYYRRPKGFVRKEVVHVNEDKTVLPDDFSREVPAAAWRWLLQYGLPYTYWLPYVGYSDSTSRLVITVGSPIRYSIGRYVGTDAEERSNGDPTFRKWRLWGDRSGFVEVLGKEKTGPVVLVEDIVSAHKVAQVATCIPLFGTKVLDGVMRELIALKRPVALWLDEDQYTLLPPKLNRLQTFLTHPVRYIKTEKDPKGYDTEQIRAILV
jgi:hypothetical protein